MTKERLKNYRYLLREKQQLLQLLGELEGEMTALRSPQLSGMPRSSSGDNRLDALIDRREELLHSYRAKIREMDTELKSIEVAIEALEDSRERLILRLYYIDGLTWEQVCVRVGYSWKQTHRIHARALRKMGEAESKAIGILPKNAEDGIE